MDTQDRYTDIFPSRLRNLLKEQKTTITSLAKTLGISRQAVSQYADGTGQPNVDKLCAIANYFNVSTDYLVGRSNYKQLESANITAEMMGITESAASALVRDKEVHAGLSGVLFSRLLCSEKFYDFASQIAEYIRKTNHAKTYGYSVSSVHEAKRAVRVEKFLVSEALFDILDDAIPQVNWNERMKKAKMQAQKAAGQSGNQTTKKSK